MEAAGSRASFWFSTGFDIVTTGLGFTAGDLNEGGGAAARAGAGALDVGAGPLLGPVAVRAEALVDVERVGGGGFVLPCLAEVFTRGRRPVFSIAVMSSGTSAMLAQLAIPLFQTDALSPSEPLTTA